MITEMVTLKSSVQELGINVNSKKKVNKQEQDMEGMKKIKEGGSKLKIAIDAKFCGFDI